MTIVETIAVCCALAASFLAIGLLRPALRILNVIDNPNERSSHSVPTLRGGGLGPVIGLSIGILVILLWQEAAKPAAWLILLASALVASAIGLMEDVKGLGVATRLALQTATGLGVGVAVAMGFSTAWWSIPLAAIFVVSYINIANFMDGINGISAFHAIVVGLSFGLTGFATSNQWLLVVGLLIASVFAGFLPWNLSRRGLFLGDVGSYLLGACISICVIVAMANGVPCVPVIAPIAIYIVDAATTIVRRVLRGEPWYQSHRSHTYQKLVQLGLSHLKVTAIVSIFTAISAAFGLVWLLDGLASELISLVGIVATSCLYLALPALLAPRVSSSTESSTK